MNRRTWKKIAVTVVAGLIVAVLLRLGGLLGKVVLWVWSGVSWIWELLYSAHPVPGGVILVLSLLALFGLAVVVLRFMSLSQSEEQAAGPDFRTYTEDCIDGVIWRWGWRGNQIYNLWCFCPSCDAQLVWQENFGETRLICERCLSDGTVAPRGSRGRVVTTVMGGDRHYAVAAASREIHRRIRASQR